MEVTQWSLDLVQTGRVGMPLQIGLELGMVGMATIQS